LIIEKTNLPSYILKNDEFIEHIYDFLYYEIDEFNNMEEMEYIEINTEIIELTNIIKVDCGT